MAGYGPVILKM